MLGRRVSAAATGAAAVVAAVTASPAIRNHARIVTSLETIDSRHEPKSH